LRYFGERIHLGSLRRSGTPPIRGALC
jgi:hypothetical protein